ncbi:MAG: hypothetical protein RL264_3080 [Bacteroidota bacterium]|jgi:hypothetical protein
MIRYVLPLTLFFFSAAVINSCAENKKSDFKNYGPVQVDSTEAISLDDMLLQFEQNPERNTFTFYAPLTGVCQTAGCWTQVELPNGKSMRVRFKDHFLIPTDTKLGELAYFHGYLYYDSISVEMQQHFAEDANATQEEIDKIKNVAFELNFEADGTLVKRVKKDKK